MANVPQELNGITQKLSSIAAQMEFISMSLKKEHTDGKGMAAKTETQTRDDIKNINSYIRLMTDGKNFRRVEENSVVISKSITMLTSDKVIKGMKQLSKEISGKFAESVGIVSTALSVLDVAKVEKNLTRIEKLKDIDIKKSVDVVVSIVKTTLENIGDLSTKSGEVYELGRESIASVASFFDAYSQLDPKKISRVGDMKTLMEFVQVSTQFSKFASEDFMKLAKHKKDVDILAGKNGKDGVIAKITTCISEQIFKLYEDMKKKGDPNAISKFYSDTLPAVMKGYSFFVSSAEGVLKKSTAIMFLAPFATIGIAKFAVFTLAIGAVTRLIARTAARDHLLTAAVAIGKMTLMMSQIGILIGVTVLVGALLSVPGVVKNALSGLAAISAMTLAIYGIATLISMSPKTVLISGIRSVLMFSTFMLTCAAFVALTITIGNELSKPQAVAHALTGFAVVAGITTVTMFTAVLLSNASFMSRMGTLAIKPIATFVAAAGTFALMSIAVGLLISQAGMLEAALYGFATVGTLVIAVSLLMKLLSTPFFAGGLTVKIGIKSILGITLFATAMSGLTLFLIGIGLAIQGNEKAVITASGTFFLVASGMALVMAAMGSMSGVKHVLAKALSIALLATVFASVTAELVAIGLALQGNGKYVWNAFAVMTATTVVFGGIIVLLGQIDKEKLGMGLLGLAGVVIAAGIMVVITDKLIEISRKIDDPKKMWTILGVVGTMIGGITVLVGALGATMAATGGIGALALAGGIAGVLGIFELFAVIIRETGNMVDMLVEFEEKEAAHPNVFKTENFVHIGSTIGSFISEINNGLKDVDVAFGWKRKFRVVRKSIQTVGSVLDLMSKYETVGDGNLKYTVYDKEGNEIRSNVFNPELSAQAIGGGFVKFVEILNEKFEQGHNLSANFNIFARATINSVMNPVSRFLKLVSKYTSEDGKTIKQVTVNKDGEIVEGPSVNIVSSATAIGDGFYNFVDILNKKFEDGHNLASNFDFKTRRTIKKIMKPISMFLDMVSSFSSERTTSPNGTDTGILYKIALDRRGNPIVGENGEIRKYPVNIKDTGETIANAFTTFVKTISTKMTGSVIFVDMFGMQFAKTMKSVMKPINDFVSVVSGFQGDVSSDGKLNKILTDRNGNAILDENGNVKTYEVNITAVGTNIGGAFGNFAKAIISALKNEDATFSMFNRQTAKTLNVMMTPLQKFTNIMSEFQSTDAGKIKRIATDRNGNPIFNDDGTVKAYEVDLGVAQEHIVGAFTTFVERITTSLKDSSASYFGPYTKNVVSSITAILNPLETFTNMLMTFKSAGEGKIQKIEYDSSGNLKDTPAINIAEVSGAVVGAFTTFLSTFIDNLDGKNARMLKKYRGKTIDAINQIISPLNTFAQALTIMGDGNIRKTEIGENGELKVVGFIDAVTAGNNIAGIYVNFVETVSTRMQSFDASKLDAISKSNIGGIIAPINTFIEAISKYDTSNGSLAVIEVGEDGKTKVTRTINAEAIAEILGGSYATFLSKIGEGMATAFATVQKQSLKKNASVLNDILGTTLGIIDSVLGIMSKYSGSTEEIVKMTTGENPVSINVAQVSGALKSAIETVYTDISGLSISMEVLAEKKESLDALNGLLARVSEFGTGIANVNVTSFDRGIKSVIIGLNDLIAVAQKPTKETTDVVISMNAAVLELAGTVSNRLNPTGEKFLTVAGKIDDKYLGKKGTEKISTIKKYNESLKQLGEALARVGESMQDLINKYPDVEKAMDILDEARRRDKNAAQSAEQTAQSGNGGDTSATVGGTPNNPEEQAAQSSMEKSRIIQEAVQNAIQNTVIKNKYGVKFSFNNNATIEGDAIIIQNG